MSLLRRIERSPATSSDSRARSSQGPSGTPQSAVQRRPVPQARDAYMDLKNRVQNRLIAELDPAVDVSRTAEVRQTIKEMYDAILQEESIILGRRERDALFEQIVAEILGLGPLEPLLADESITEIMVNGPKKLFVERNGRLERVNVSFESDEHLMRIIERIVAPLGRRIDESSPTVDARLKDGSRVNAVIPPISLYGPILTIRKFFKKPLTVEDLIRFGTITDESIEFLRASVVAATNIVVSGGTGTGKTTFLNVLSSYIPTEERVITIENAAELQLRQEHVVTLESRPPNVEGKGQVTIRDLVINSLRMRPDRIVVGECRGGEALDMLQAMNTGHEGSMTTLHANNTRDALSRLETMVLMAGMELPHRAIREQIAAAIDMIVQLERMRDGSRRVTSITEVQGMEGEVITTADIFKFEQSGYEDNRVIGRLRPTGIRPKFMDRIEQAGIHLPPSIFGVAQRLRY
ncbi:MAG: CpaF family protein [Anaerolineae bacterium]|nr:CpaF family protein [Anaerolineae bacterium]